jgi:hypothetical protein
VLQFFYNLFIFQGTVVAVKKIDKSRFNLTRSLLIELKTVSNFPVNNIEFRIHIFTDVGTFLTTQLL